MSRSCRGRASRFTELPVTRTHSATTAADLIEPGLESWSCPAEKSQRQEKMSPHGERKVQGDSEDGTFERRTAGGSGHRVRPPSRLRMRLVSPEVATRTRRARARGALE